MIDVAHSGHPRGSVADAELACANARDQLLARQSPGGWWRGELRTNVTVDAEDLLMREFLGIRDPGATERTARWIRSQQRGDGTWASFHAGPSSLSTTLEAYAALRLAGDPADADHMRSAASFVRERGGVAGARVFTRFWFALFGLWPWERVPSVPPEIVLMPAWTPLNLYTFAGWARQAMVPLAITTAERPVHAFPVSLDELSAGAPATPRRPQRSMLGGVPRLLDRLAKGYEAHHPRALRRLALSQAERWIIARQEADGSFGGSQPPMVYSLIALSLRGFTLDHPVVRAALEAIDSFIVDKDGMRRMEPCQSPVWDTALAIIALRDAGLPDDHPALLKAADWLLEREVSVRGDWAVRRPHLNPGGWSFEFANDNYPDLDDSAVVALALRRVSHPAPKRIDAAVERACRWIMGMQSTSGGWAAFERDNTPVKGLSLPYFGEVFDPPSVDITAHVLELFAAEGLTEHPSARAGLRWMCAQQEATGSWFGRWGVNHVYGAGTVLPALAAAGVGATNPRVRRTVDWLEVHQNDDGGWGEDVRSYTDPSWIGRGLSTASQTAWALLALHAAGERTDAVRRGIAWLTAHQRIDGTWDEPWFTGTGFPGAVYLHYELYGLIFPVMALGRYLASRSPTAP